MSSKPVETLSLSQQERISAEEKTEQFGSVFDILADLVEKVSDSSALENLKKTIPWLGHAATATGEALPPIKAALHFVEKVTTIDDPLDLALIACSTSYGQACLEAISFVGKPGASIAFPLGKPPRNSN